jgi:hypothetical protein
MLDRGLTVQARRGCFDGSVLCLVESLEVTMVQHPMAALRNMAFWALDSLLNALQVISSLCLPLWPLPLLLLAS